MNESPRTLYANEIVGS